MTHPHRYPRDFICTVGAGGEEWLNLVLLADFFGYKIKVYKRITGSTEVCYGEEGVICNHTILVLTAKFAVIDILRRIYRKQDERIRRNMKLSNRLLRVALNVTPGYRVADVGTDHGYVPIYLMENGMAAHVIAMDINAGPLERAEAHIKENNLKDCIETRRSDGFSSLRKDEADIAVIAGMGGELIKSILEQGRDVVRGFRELVLSPHSEIDVVRRFLHEIGFRIVKEEMLIDDGKFYTIIKAVKGNDRNYTDVEYRYGALLIENKDEILHKFLIMRKKKLETILSRLEEEQTMNVRIRKEQLYGELMEIDGIIGYRV